MVTECFKASNFPILDNNLGKYLFDNLENKYFKFGS